jgi:hypothetical protein
MRNCYGTNTADLKSGMRQDLPLFLLNSLLDLSKCGNSQSQRNGLANFNELNIFAGHKMMNKINDMDRSGALYDLSSNDKLLGMSLEELLAEFDRLNCRGYGFELTELYNKYNNNGNGSGSGSNGSNNLLDSLGGNNGSSNNGSDEDIYGNIGNGGNKPMFPGGLTDSQKDQILNLIGNNNNYNDNLLDGKNNNNTFVLDGNSGNGSGDDKTYDDLFGDSSGNVLTKIPVEELENLTFTTTVFKCFEPVFLLDNYIFVSSNKKQQVIVTREKAINMKKIHNEILLPIFNHYFGEGAPATCQMKINFALGSVNDIVTTIGGSSFSRHIRGEAVDFSIVGVDTSKVLEDIKSGVINIDFGVITLTNGIHLTLPYTFEGLDIRRVVLSSPKKSKNSLKIEFL